MVMYYKITNEPETYNGYTYKTGVNEWDEKLLGKGSFYFTTIDNIHKFYKQGIYLREVELIDDNSIVVTKDLNQDIWRASAIILKERHYLLDPETVAKFYLPISPYFMDKASELGDVSTLEKWRKMACYSDRGIDITLDLEYSSRSLDLASQNGHVQVLKWWESSNLDLRYTHLAIDSASKKGYIHVLNWWRNTNLPLKYTNEALDSAIDESNVDVIAWWKGSGLEIKYTDLVTKDLETEKQKTVTETIKKTATTVQNFISSSAKSIHENIQEFGFQSRFMGLLSSAKKIITKPAQQQKEPESNIYNNDTDEFSTPPASPLAEVNIMGGKL